VVDDLLQAGLTTDLLVHRILPLNCGHAKPFARATLRAG
jgi:hypothetical protein